MEQGGQGPSKVARTSQAAAKAPALSMEVLQSILLLLTLSEAHKASRTNKAWKEAFESPASWQQRLLLAWPFPAHRALVPRLEPRQYKSFFKARKTGERLYVQEWSIGTVTRLHRQTLEQRFPHDFRIEIVVFDERDGRVLSADLIDPSDAAALMALCTDGYDLRFSTANSEKLEELRFSVRLAAIDIRTGESSHIVHCGHFRIDVTPSSIITQEIEGVTWDTSPRIRGPSNQHKQHEYGRFNQQWDEYRRRKYLPLIPDNAWLSYLSPTWYWRQEGGRLQMLGKVKLSVSYDGMDMCIYGHEVENHEDALAGLKGITFGLCKPDDDDDDDDDCF